MIVNYIYILYYKDLKSLQLYIFSPTATNCTKIQNSQRGDGRWPKLEESGRNNSKKVERSGKKRKKKTGNGTNGLKRLEQKSLCRLAQCWLWHNGDFQNWELGGFFNACVLSGKLWAELKSCILSRSWSRYWSTNESFGSILWKWLSLNWVNWNSLLGNTLRRS